MPFLTHFKRIVLVDLRHHCTCVAAMQVITTLIVVHTERAGAGAVSVMHREHRQLDASVVTSR